MVPGSDTRADHAPHNGIFLPGLCMPDVDGNIEQVVFENSGSND